MRKVSRARSQWGQNFSKQRKEGKSMPGSKNSVDKAQTWLIWGHEVGNRYRQVPRDQHVRQRICPSGPDRFLKINFIDV